MIYFLVEPFPSGPVTSIVLLFPTVKLAFANGRVISSSVEDHLLSEIAVPSP